MNESNVKELVCTLCPVHCNMSIEYSKWGDQIKNVYGSRCSRGYEYIKNYKFDQQCMLPTSVRLRGNRSERLPVNSDGLLPKTIVTDAMSIIKTLEVELPVKSGEIIVENILNTGVNIVATKSMY